MCSFRQFTELNFWKCYFLSLRKLGLIKKIQGKSQIFFFLNLIFEALNDI